MYNVRKDLTVLGLIAFFIFLIVVIALTGSSTAFWYGQIVLQLVMAGIVLSIAFRGEVDE